MGKSWDSVQVDVHLRASTSSANRDPLEFSLRHTTEGQWRQIDGLVRVRTGGDWAKDGRLRASTMFLYRQNLLRNVVAAVGVNQLIHSFNEGHGAGRRGKAVKKHAGILRNQELEDER